MRIQPIMMCLLLAFCSQVFAQYNAETIQSNLAEQADKFDILGWSKENGSSTWQAQSKIKRQYLTISNTKAELILPFLNPQEKQRGLSLCESFIALAIDAKDKNQISDINDLIRKSTTRHIIKFSNMNGMRYTIAPTIKRNVVSLHCTVST